MGALHNSITHNELWSLFLRAACGFRHRATLMLQFSSSNPWKTTGSGSQSHVWQNVPTRCCWTTEMILRLSQKLAKKIKAGTLTEMSLDENPYADWSCHLFTAGRTQYIIMSNTASLYSCVMYGRGISDDRRFIERALTAIREFMEDDGQQFVYRRFIAPASGMVRFAKALSRSVTGSMNDHVQAAKFYLADGMAPHEVGFRLNQTPLSALTDANGRKYANPREVFKLLAGSRRSDDGRNE